MRRLRLATRGPDWSTGASGGLFVLGGAIGGILGLLAARQLAGRKQALTYIFAAIVITAGLYVTGSALLR